MSENTWTSSKCQGRLLISVKAFAFLCIAASAAILVVVFLLFILDCAGCRSYFALLGTLAAALLTAGLLTLSTILCCNIRHINTTPQVVISSIPAEDLEKSAAPILSYSHVPRHLPFIETSSIDSLPDYFAVVQNPDEVYLSVDAGGWAEDVPETPPPCYEQALQMTTYAA